LTNPGILKLDDRCFIVVGFQDMAVESHPKKIGGWFRPQRFKAFRWIICNEFAPPGGSEANRKNVIKCVLNCAQAGGFSE
jgi:hypothetical protein